MDSSGYQALVPDDLLAPDSAAILVLAVSVTTPTARDLLLLFYSDCNNGKPYVILKEVEQNIISELFRYRQ